MKKTIELIRVSTEGQAASDRAGIPAQRAANRATAARYNLEIIRSIEMTDVSGTAVLLAPEMQEMFRLMKSPEVHGVVTKEFSRLLRPKCYSDYAIMDQFVETQTILYLPDGPIDFSSDTGQMMGPMRTMMAGWERRVMLDRVWRAKEEKRRRGELVQSKVVLGWGVGYEAGRGFFYKPEAERIREAFRMLLGGDASYNAIARLLNVTPRGARLILQNPIWTGWRVINKRRGPEHYPARDGRQADRKKIMRAPEEIIRVRVIDQPLVSQEDFDRAQAIMHRKQARHWRSLPNYERRFIYGGFLTCSECGQMLYSAFQRRDYYVCKARRGSHSKTKPWPTGHRCRAPYMRRERLETALDRLFARELWTPRFLRTCVEVATQAPRQDELNRTARLANQVGKLRNRREKVVDTYLEGAIGREERDRRLVEIDSDLATAETLLQGQPAQSEIDVESLVNVLAPLAEWEHWTVEQKRRVLAALVPDIRVAGYRVESLGIRLPGIAGFDDARTGRDSWPPPA